MTDIFETPDYIEVTVQCDLCSADLTFHHHGAEGDLDTLLTAMAMHQRYGCWQE